MSLFADTNWLEALYIKPQPDDAESIRRGEIAEARLRRGEPLVISPIVLMEARNVFSRITKDPHPPQWDQLVADFDGAIFVDPINWSLVRRQTEDIFERFAHKATIGTLDAAIIASAQLAGARQFLSFDQPLKALAIALGIPVFPDVDKEGRAFLAKLRAR